MATFNTRCFSSLLPVDAVVVVVVVVAVVALAVEELTALAMVDW